MVFASQEVEYVFFYCVWNHSQSAAISKVTLSCEDSNKMAIRQSKSFSMQWNGVKSAITCNLFVMIWWLTVTNWQKIANLLLFVANLLLSACTEIHVEYLDSESSQKQVWISEIHPQIATQLLWESNLTSKLLRCSATLLLHGNITKTQLLDHWP